MRDTERISTYDEVMTFPEGPTDTSASRSVRKETLAMVLDELRLLIVLLAPDGAVVWANRVALGLGECALADIVGAPLAAGPWWPTESERLDVQAALDRAAAGEAVQLEVDAGRGSAGPHRLALSLRQLSAQPSEAWILVKGSDLTEARAREAREAAQYRAVVDTQTEVISRFAADGTLRFVNDAYCRLFGGSRLTLIGRPWRPVAHPDDVARIEVELRRMSKEEPVIIVENRVIDAEGRVRWFEFVNRGFYDAAGQLVEVQSIGRDVTLRREGEAERQLAERRLQERQRREGLGLLAGGVAHDFNNVLACITTSVALARIEPAEVDVYLDEIAEASDRAAMLCRQMLAYAGKSPLAPVWLDLGAQLRGSEPLLRAMLPVGATLRMHLAPGLPAVRGDETQLRQIFLNLVGNACEALREHGVITVSARRDVAANGRVDGGELDAEVADGPVVVVAVRDNGVGMPAEVRARIFEPFFTTKHGNQGTGLGLAVVYGIVVA
jgi:two-component system, cell cycle sensor histidine kinase and response regulator CckA